ncbi:hypothetical protein [Flavobacterium sp. NKUCC04_CG]|uniref:hypothetical protein n=1 Tax=Flavobacterium sp. NKUCC04_CG TaxID=2842121 RepID=UPI001C5BA27F|nr:hypothetical protein [Flavobacterium sp. NKUCC04_CG]MBW3518599.1 hypothetical protein [Flavobacterium sp. NKUCC04_CG]
MKRKLLPLATLFLFGIAANAQVGIGTQMPNASTQLEVVSTNKGILIPRVALTDTFDSTTIKNGNVNSLLVFNTTDNATIKTGYYYWLKDEWVRLIGSNEINHLKNTVNVSLTLVNDELIITDSEQHQVKMPWNNQDIVALNETETKIIKNADGSYTYINERGIEVIIDITASVIQNFEEILNTQSVQNIFNEYVTKVAGNVIYDGTNFIYYDDNGIEQTINITEMVKGNETITQLQKVSEGKYTYYNEASFDTHGVLLPGATGVTIDVITDVTNNFEEILNEETIKNLFNEFFTTIKGNVTFDGNNFFYYDEHGVQQTINITEMVKANETLTQLVKVGEGKYTYYNEASYDSSGVLLPGATGITIDVITDVTNNFEDIINEETIKNIFKEYFTTIEGNVTFDGTNFYYTDSTGTSQTIDIEGMVKAHETLTSLRDVVTQQEDEFGIMSDLHTLTYTDEKGVAHPIDLKVLVKGVETITELNYDGVTHVLSYKNEKAEVTDFNLVDLVGDVQTLTKLELDIDNKKLEYTDENQVTHTLDLALIIQEPWYSTLTNIGAVSNTDNIYTQGWVGIGFSEPSDVPHEKLRVNGTITTVNSHYADYVFEDYFDGYSQLKSDYKFSDLETIADFIEKNRHLPGITPIGDLEQTTAGFSFNVSELSIQLLEKTEELYLHLIDQKRSTEQENIAQSEKIEELQLQLSQQNYIIDEKNTQIENLISNNQEVMLRLSKLESQMSK